MFCKLKLDNRIAEKRFKPKKPYKLHEFKDKRE